MKQQRVFEHLTEDEAPSAIRHAQWPDSVLSCPRYGSTDTRLNRMQCRHTRSIYYWHHCHLTFTDFTVTPMPTRRHRSASGSPP